MTRNKFGDDANKVSHAFLKAGLRLVLCIPAGAVGIALSATVVGLPLGLPLLAACGAFISKPIRKHPLYAAPPRHNTKRPSEQDVEYMEDW